MAFSGRHYPGFRAVRLGELARQPVHNLRFRILMGNAIAGGELLFRFIDLFEDLQALLHPFIFVGINQNRHATSALGQHHRAAGFLNLLYERGDARPEFRQRPDIFIDMDP